MQLKMDATALTAFLAREFGQVAGEFAVERADEAGVTLRLKVADGICDRAARSAGRRSLRWRMWRCIWRS
jgi:hypothetical protein